jgi:hypothetical protein
MVLRAGEDVFMCPKQHSALDIGSQLISHSIYKELGGVSAASQAIMYRVLLARTTRVQPLHNFRTCYLQEHTP